MDIKPYSFQVEMNTKPYSFQVETGIKTYSFQVEMDIKPYSFQVEMDIIFVKKTELFQNKWNFLWTIKKSKKNTIVFYSTNDTTERTI